MMFKSNLRDVMDRGWIRLGDIDNTPVYSQLGAYVSEVVHCVHDTECTDDDKNRMIRHMGDIQETLRDAYLGYQEKNAEKAEAHLKVVAAMLCTFQFFYRKAEESPNRATLKIDAYISTIANGVRLLMLWGKERR